MNTMNTMILNTKKKAFTLIELLIVVAIIGILAGVGIPMYNGYMANAKVESANTNHANSKSFIAATLTSCASGIATVSINNANVDCKLAGGGNNGSGLEKAFIAYFASINKNPYAAATASMVKGTATPALGQSFLKEKDGVFTLKSNVGTNKGKEYVKGPVSMTLE